MAHTHSAACSQAHHDTHADGHHHHPGHDHGAHASELAASRDGRRRVAAAGLVTALFMLVEIAGGLISGSLALLADAAHMGADAAALLLAWFGFRLAERPADARRSFGFGRFRILAAFTNGLTLIALAVWIVAEAAGRLLHPPAVEAPLMTGVAVAGFACNLIAFALLHGGDRHNLNLSAALWHVAGDLLGSVAAITAGVVIWLTGWTPVDPILSALIAVLVGMAGWRIARQSAHILLEGTPAGLDPDAIAADLSAHVAAATGVYHVHAWSLTETRPLVTLHVRAHDGADPEALRTAIRARLHERFGVSHATIEIEDARANPTDCAAGNG